MLSCNHNCQSMNRTNFCILALPYIPEIFLLHPCVINSRNSSKLVFLEQDNVLYVSILHGVILHSDGNFVSEQTDFITLNTYLLFLTSRSLPHHHRCHYHHRHEHRHSRHDHHQYHHDHRHQHHLQLRSSPLSLEQCLSQKNDDNTQTNQSKKTSQLTAEPGAVSLTAAVLLAGYSLTFALVWSSPYS